MVCDALPEDPDAIGQLDGDTAVSRNTFKAALAAAGAVCTAVDEVMSGAVSPAGGGGRLAPALLPGEPPCRACHAC